jgi:ATP-dependent RNA helicase RhlE
MNIDSFSEANASAPGDSAPTFVELGLLPALLKALNEQGYERPTPIQAQAIPAILEGHDLFGIAQTGTGKTAAFALPLLQRLHNQPQMEQFRSKERDPSTRNFGTPKVQRPIRALVLSPTRELAIQISESFEDYGRHLGLRSTVIFGGVGQTPQVEALRRGVDILVATPGRLLDLMSQGFIKLDQLQAFILDEADRMLDMGFIHDIRKVLPKLPPKRQSLFFSATLPPSIQDLAGQILRDPIQVKVTPVSSTVDTIQQHLYHVAKADKRHLLQLVLTELRMKAVLVFTRTKHGADRVVKDLEKSGIHAMAIHGNKSQGARQRALEGFKGGSLRVLVATDIAARGIDVDDLQWVVNMDLPDVPETYVHRIGRTGRAGASGVALTFCDEDERTELRDIEKLIGKHIPVIEEHPYALRTPAPNVLQVVHGKGRGSQSVSLQESPKSATQIAKAEEQRKRQARIESRPKRDKPLTRGEQLGLSLGSKTSVPKGAAKGSSGGANKAADRDFTKPQDNSDVRFGRRPR